MMLQTAELFGNNMVLQRDKPVQIWGTGEIGETVSCVIQGTESKTVVGEDGNWSISLPELYASEEETLTIRTKEDEITYCNVAVGEVWIAAGQSNMQFQMRYDKDFKEMLKNCKNRNIRFFDYPVVRTQKERGVLDFSEFGFWRPCDAENLQYYSAVAYYFAEDIQKDLDVPVGILGGNCGGSSASCWMDEETLERCGAVWRKDYEHGLEGIENLDEIEKAFYESPESENTLHPFAAEVSDKLMYGISLEEMQKAIENIGSNSILLIGPWHEWRPNGLYYTMQQKIVPYTVRGILWYQGESDENHPEIYADMMCGLIDLWRKDWKEDLPFIMTQLAPYGEILGNGGKFYPVLREQQEEVTKRMDKVWLASIGDVGNVYDIHPKEKKPVGRRLALLARGHVYHEDILCEAPEIQSAVKENDQIILTFANADVLHCKGDRINALHVVKEGIEIPADKYKAEIAANRVVITLPGLAGNSPIQVSFAKEAYYEVNLCNASDIPTKPFTILIE